MRKLLLNPTPLFRKLRQLSMLLTLLLALPQTAWGNRYTTTGNVTDATGNNAGTRFTWNTNATETAEWRWVIDCEAGTVTPDISTLTFTLQPNKNITMSFGGSTNGTNADYTKLRKFTFDGLSNELTVSAALTQESTTYNFTGSNGVFTPSGNTNSIDMNGVLNVTITNNSANSVTCTINSITVLTGQIISSDGLVWSENAEDPSTGSAINGITKNVSNNVTTLSGNLSVDDSFHFPLKRDFGDQNIVELNKGDNLNYDIAYSSSNTNVAEVSGGDVTIKGYGSTTITATLTENDYYSYEQSTYSYTLTNTETYGLTIAGTAVTSENAANILGDGKVAFTPASEANDNKNILSLNNAVITTGGIVSSIGDLTINIKGVNNIGDNSSSIATGISSTNDGTLTFTVDGSGGRLSFDTTTSAVSGFADVTLDTGTYLMYQTNGVPAKYDTNSKNYYTQSGSTGIVKLMQVTSEAYYPLWVKGAQVSHLTPNIDFTFTAATNTLALSSAWINAGIVSGLDNLIITLNGNNTIELSDTTAAIRSINPAATLTIQKSASAENGSLNMKNNVDDASSSPVIKNFASVSHTGLNFVSKTGTTLEAATVHDAVLSSAEIYPLWIGGTLVTAATHSFNGTSGTIDYSSETNTLTLTGYQNTFATGHAIETGIVGLKVKLVGDNYITCQDNSGFAFYTQQSTASVQFTKVDATSKLTMTTNGDPISGFGDGKVTYDGLFYYANGDSKLITQPAAPELSKRTAYDDKNISYTYAFIDYAAGERTGNANDGYTALYASANPVKKYSFDYVDPNIEDVTNQNYPATGGIKLTAPGILTAWIEVGTAKSAESKGVRFGILGNPIEMVFNGEEKQIDFTPAPTMTNPVTVAFNGAITFATHDATNNKLTIKSCLNDKVSVSFTNTDGGYTSLNDSTLISFNIKPTKPTLSKAAGIYEAAQTVAITSTYQGTGGTLYYYYGDDPTSATAYTAALDIDATKRLVAYVEVNGVKSDTVRADYTIRTAPNLSYSVTSMGATVNGGGFAQPVLSNPSSIDVSYSSSNTAVATINNSGDITLVGAGETTIQALPTDTFTYTPTPAKYVLRVTRNLQNPFSNTNGLNYVTFYNDNEDLALPSGLAAYIITGVSGNSVTTSATGYLPHNVPVLLEKTGNLDDNLTFNGYAGDAGDFSGNKLKYANADVATTDDTYVLFHDEFVKATGDINQGSNYLDLSGVAPSRGMYGIGDGSTAIDATLMNHEGTNNEEWYDLQGRRIQKPTKAGLYIVNGKKIVINNK